MLEKQREDSRHTWLNVCTGADPVGSESRGVAGLSMSRSRRANVLPGNLLLEADMAFYRNQDFSHSGRTVIPGRGSQGLRIRDEEGISKAHLGRRDRPCGGYCDNRGISGETRGRC